MKTLNKRIIAIITIIAILIGFVPVHSNAAATVPEDVSVTMNITGTDKTVTSAKAGDTVSVDVWLDNCIANQKAFEMEIAYDDTKLEVQTDFYDEEEEYYGFEPGKSLSSEIANFTMGELDTSKSELDKAIIFAAYNSTTSARIPTEKVKLATFTFKVLEGFDETTNITFVSILSEDSNDSYDYTGNEITINPIVPMTGLTITPTTLNLQVGDTSKVTASKIPATTTDNTAITYRSSNTGVVTVDSEGNVTAKSVGEATITATCGSVPSATCDVTVSPIPVTGLTVAPKTSEVSVGKTVTLTATRQPEGADSTKAISWMSSDENIATVDNNGKVTAKANGTVTITATCEGYSDTATIDVGTPMTGLDLDAVKITINKDETMPIVATKVPETTTNNTEISWTTADATIATVDENGNVTGVNKGTTTITATCGSFSKTCAVEVKLPLENITIDDGNIELPKTQSKNLTITYNPDDTTDSKSVTWSSDDESVVKVENGRVTAVGTGTANITATSDANQLIKDTITITVPVVTADSVVISESSLTLEKGKSSKLNATILPENNTEEKVVVWSSEDETIATVDQNGNVTAIKGGTTNIVATVEGLSPAVCPVSVTCKLESIALDKTEMTLEAGDSSEALNVTINPEDATVDTSTVTWESKATSIATVDANGVVTAVAPGTAVIVATLDGKTAQCVVTVKLTLESATINNNTTPLELVKGTKGQLSVTLNPTGATEIPTPVWSSSDEAIATVDANGKVTAIASGTATITVNYGNDKNGNPITSNITVKVTEIPATGVVFDETIDLILKGGDNSVTLVATAYPADTTDEETIIWSSSDETIATVDANGKVTGLKAGDVTITATYGAVSNTMNIKVEEVPLTSIQPVNDKVSVQEGKTTVIGVNCVPANTTDDKTFTYTSSDETIATVDANGKVTAKKAGTVTITVASTVNPAATTQVELTVTSAPASSNPSPVGGASGAGAVAEAVAGTVTSPHTGDMNVGLLVTMLVISILGIAFVMRKK